MIRMIKNVTGSSIHLKDIGVKLAAGAAEEIESVQLKMYLGSSELSTAIDEGDIQVGNGTTYYTDPDEGQCYLRTMFGDDFYIIDDNGLSKFSPVIVTDSNTGKKASSMAMNMLTIMRELYNAPTDSLYDSDFVPILGESGWAEDHVDRIANIETIHGDLGWHTQQVVQATYQKPLDLLIYYGWINPFNSGSNGWSNEAVAQDMAKYSLIVLGDGMQDPEHGDYDNTSIVIPRIKALNPNTKIFGYVTLNQSFVNFQTKASQWNTLGVHGIFIDEAGYDYGNTSTNNRDAFNTKVDYVHALSTANLCFVNAWNMDHIIGTANDTSYPNSTWNPSLLSSKLTYNDWYLLESFSVNTAAYSGSNGYAPKADWAARGIKCIGHRNTYGINLASVGVIANNDTNDQALFDFSFNSACMWSLEANGSSDASYGSGSAAVEFHTRPDVSKMGRIYSLSPSVQADAGDADVYWRYVDFGKFKVDFSTGAQLSSVTKW